MLKKQKLLIVDDDEDLRTQMKWALAEDYEILLAEDRPSAVAAMRKELPAVEKGAYDFFYNPIQLDELKVVLRRAFHLSQLEREQRALQKRLSGDTFEGM